MDPQIFGIYRIISKLSGGGMGRVYMAEDTRNKQRLALKLIDDMPDPETQEVIEAEKKGAILQARLAGVDERVTKIFDYGIRDGYLFIAMEYVAGRDLSEILAHGPLPAVDAVRIAADVCGVLANAHTFRAVLDDQEYQGIVHGDIKPRNIRITPQGAVKVLDFGIAKALSLTRKYTVNQFGSVPYSSPERLNSGEVDASSDVWAVGVVLYEMLVGHPYFEAETVSKLENAVRNYTTLGNSFDRIPPELRGMLAKALDPHPDRRYGTAADLLRDLRQYRNPPTLRVNGSAPTDMEATRRTGRPSPESQEETRRSTSTAVADDSTRRTAPAGPPPLPNTTRSNAVGVVSPAGTPTKAQPVAGVARPATPLSRKHLLIRRGIQGAVLALFFIAMINEGRTWRKATELERGLQTEKVNDLDDAWQQYQDLSKRSYLPGATAGLKKAILSRLTADADHVINRYREGDNTIVYLKDWQGAESSLAHAMELSPDDKTVRGKLRLVEGHIARIQAGNAAGGRSWTEARMRFEEATNLLSHDPDPYLGLARLYLIGGRDLDKAEDAIHEAERRGYHVMKRDKAMLADGYRVRAEGWLKQITNFPTPQQQNDYLNRADSDLAHAEDLVRDIVPYGNSVAMLRRINDDRHTVAQDKDTLGKAEPPKWP